MTTEIDRTSISFGSIAKGDSATAQLEVRNGGGAAIAVSTAAAGVSVSPATVPPGEAAVVTVTWAPTATGALSGSVTVEGAAGAVSLSGTATDRLSFSPTSLDLGSVAVGSSGVASVMVENLSGSAATLALSGTGAAGYSIVPSSVGAGMSALVQVTFSPTAVQSYPASLTEDGEASPAATLTGAGVLSEAPSVIDTAVQDDDTSDTSAGTVKRFTLDVPDSDGAANYAILNLGVEYAAGSIDVDGFGLFSKGKGFITTEGKLALQSVTDVYLQSLSGDFVAVTSGDSTIAAGGNATLLADGGVTISTAVDDPTTQENADPKVARTWPDPDNASLKEGAGDALTRVCAGFDAIIAASTAFDAFCAMVEKTDDGVPSAGNRAWSGVTAAVATAGAVASGLAVAGSGLAPGVTIYGHGGVFIASPFISGFYSVGGIVIGSMFPLVLGIDAELRGLHAATITGGASATVQAGEVNIQGKKASKLGSRGAKIGGLQRGDGVVNVVGHEVHVSAHKTVATKEVHSIDLDDQAVCIAVGKFRVVVKPDGVSVGQASAVKKADASTDLETTKPHALITDTEIKLLSKDGGTVATLTDGSILLEESPDGTGLFIEKGLANLSDLGSKHWVKVQDDMVSIQGGTASNKLQVMKSGLTFKGQTIKLG